VLGPGLLSVAFLVGPKVKLAAVVLIVRGAIWARDGNDRVAAGTANPIATNPASSSRADAWFSGMALAATWALGEYPLQPLVDLARMERDHGALNAVGFGI